VRPKPRDMNLVDVKWDGRDRILLYLGDAVSVIATKERWDEISLGWIDLVFTSKNYIFVTYGEEAVYSASSARKGDLEAYAMAVFSQKGDFLVGLATLFEETNETQWIADVGSGYTRDDCMVFHGSEVDCLWHLDARTRRLKKLPVPFSTLCIEVLSGDDRKAFAIYDNRNLLRYQYHPDWPTFELASFDLQSGAASKQDFGPVETALLDAGFDMHAIRFRQSASGRIIVADGVKAALLEISEAG